MRLAAAIDEKAVGIVDEETLYAISRVVLEATQGGVTQASLAETAGQFGKVATVVGAGEIATTSRANHECARVHWRDT